MALEREAAREDRGRLLTGGLVLLGAATGLGLGAVFMGLAPTLRLVAAGAAAVMVGAALQRRNVLLSLLAGVAGLALAIGVLVFPSTTWAGLPTRETLVAAQDAVARVARDAASQAAPAPALSSLLLSSVVAVWAAGYAAHALAARATSPVLALFPPAALVAFAGMVADDGPHPIRAGTLLAASFVVLFGSGLDRLRLWGPILPWPGFRRWRLARGAGRHARRLALAATAVALLLPGLLPGFSADPLLDLTQGTGGPVSISPIVDIRPNLLRNPAVELFRVRAERPAYWRLLSLDRFDGRLWTSNDLEARTGLAIPDGSVLADRLTQPRPGAVTIDQEFLIAGLTTPWMPAAFTARSVQVAGDFRFDRIRDTLVRDGGTGPGLNYSVTSDVMVPSPEQLDAAAAPSAAGLDAVYTQLPRNLPPRVSEIAREITSDEPNAYRRILAIQSHLRSFTYDEAAPAGHGIDDMLFFLERSRRGYCEQFAGTMAVLLRTLGYPSRVAIGFLPGVQDDQGTWRVTTEETHAWVEVFFPDFGWLAFEPTPTRINPMARTYILPAGPVGGAGPFVGEEAFVRTQGQRQQQLGDQPPVEDPGPAEGAGGNAPVDPWTLALLGLGLALSVAVALPLGKAWLRRRALARARSPSQRVVAAFGVVQGVAADLGLGRRGGETLHEYRDRLRESVALSDGHLDLVTGLVEMALYSERPVPADGAGAAVTASRVVVRDLRRSVGMKRRLLGALRPSF
ncbi:MAG TPA: transglutaminaseTgpA domain-containing protein [Actinomycetota bacterium]|jgi:transglutaminase-like putative cysteine protease|nr:transglutaminaseTgpA domain-containing protein [Actinomycetota bacterium]